jgi:hypothetical protein
MADKYYVLIMDVIDSSGFPDRDILTGKLEDAAAKANAEFSRYCLSPFEITKGDEIAAVLISISRAYEMVKIFREMLYPADIRSVIAYDELKAGLETKRSTVIDGPAFYRGNRMMLELKKTQRTFALDTQQEKMDEAIDSLMNLLLWQWNNFSDLQQKIIRLYQQEKNQWKVAKMIDRTQQQVHKTLTSCKWEIIDNAEKTIMDMFRFIDEANSRKRKTA